MFGLGAGEAILIGLALVVLFGARKIPTLARGLGEGIRNFKGAVEGGTSRGEEEPPSLEDGETREPRARDR